MQLSLNGAWSFRQGTGSTILPATVPGCVHTDLLRQGLIPDPFHGRNEFAIQWIEEEDWEYFREFEVDAELLKNDTLELVCEGLDTVATIHINGQVAGSASNMFHPHRFEVKSLVKLGTNSIQIFFTSPIKRIRELNQAPLKPEICDRVGGRSLLRKEQCSFGWDWGARFVSSGIFESIYLHAWNQARLDSVRVEQKHTDGQVGLTLHPEYIGTPSEGCILSATLSFADDTVATADTTLGKAPLHLQVKQPRLWWTHGLGEHPLYHLSVVLKSRLGKELSRWERKIGLCEVRLEQKPDAWGTSFHFTINGVPVFAKGANWIPLHSFQSERTPERYADLIQSAADANMNMLRVWGGGSYERDCFYELCDEKGILVWQDFMFALAIYPGDAGFLESVKTEATYQVKRLRHHAGLALWCGNNEIEFSLLEQASTGETSERYQAIFYQMLPEIVRELHPACSYIPSSPFNAAGLGHPTGNEDSGDAHFWDVWHDRRPVELYEEKHHRFYSEFGMQAYPHAETAATFTDDPNLFGPDLDAHQKNGAGNAIIFDYVSRLYRFPKDYRSAAYLSQFNQAYCMKTGIEHYRRNMPRIMGALFWQLNDNWPVASWSSIDFGGRWKALQFAARRFFAPLLISVKRLGKEEMHLSTNTLFSTIRSAEIHATYDGLLPVNAAYSWALHHLQSSEVLRSESHQRTLAPNTSSLLDTLDFSDEIERHGRENIVLQTRLEAKGYDVSENTTYFTPPKRIHFARSSPTLTIEATAHGTFKLTLVSDVFLPHVMLYFTSGHDFRASDSFFDLYPLQPKTISLKPLPEMDLPTFQQNLRVTSLAELYM